MDDSSAGYLYYDDSPDGDNGATSVGLYYVSITYSSGTLPSSVSSVSTEDSTVEVPVYGEAEE